MTLENRRITCQRYHSLFFHDTTSSTTPFTTPTPRQRPRLELRLNGTYSYNYVKRLGHRNPVTLNVKNSTPSSKTPLFGTTPRTEGSTETLVVHYTAGRVLSTATPPHRVLLFSELASFD